MTQTTMTNQARVNQLIATTKPVIYPDTNEMGYEGKHDAVVIQLDHNYIFQSATYFDENGNEHPVANVDEVKLDWDFTDGMNELGYYQPEAA